MVDTPPPTGAAGRGDARRAALLEAAVQVLAAGGAQALTHRSVEAAAGAAHGSTRYYFSTRSRLLEAVLEHLALADQRSAELARPVTTGPSAGQVAAATVEVLERWLGPDRARTLARYEIFLEAARRQELQPALRRWGATFWSRAEPVVAALGSTDPGTDARNLVELVDGLLLSQLARPREDFVPAARRALTSYLTGLA